MVALTRENQCRARAAVGASGRLQDAQSFHERPLSNMTLLAALKRMGYGQRMTGHRFRGVASTALNEMGFRPDVIEAHAALSMSGHRTRRAALALLTKSGAELVGIVREHEGRAALEDVAASLEDYRTALHGLSELMEQAATRLAVALCEPVAE